MLSPLSVSKLLAALAVSSLTTACGGLTNEADQDCPGDTCTFACEAGATDCDIVCPEEQSCEVECNDAATCDVQGNDPTVVVTCEDAASCDVECSQAGSCNVDCNGAADCTVTCPASGCEVTSCGDGCTVTCGFAPGIPVDGTVTCE